MIAIDLKPGLDRAVFRRLKIIINGLFPCFLEFQSDLVVFLDLTRRDIDLMVIDENKSVADDLPSLLTGCREAKLINDVIQPAFQHLEQNGTGNTFGAHGLAEVILKLLFKHAVNSFDLLLLAHMQTEVRKLCLTRITVLPRGISPAFDGATIRHASC